MKVPLIRTDTRAHLGEAQEKPEFADPALARGDLTYVPGWSDLRRQRDADVREGRKPAPLPYRLQLVRVRNSMGLPDGQGAASWRAQGYQEVKVNEMKELGIAMPIGGMASADGFVDVGDLRLFACDAQRAAQNEQNWRRATDEVQATDRAPALEAEGRKHASPTFVEGTYSDAGSDDPDS